MQAKAARDQGKINENKSSRSNWYCYCKSLQTKIIWYKQQQQEAAKNKAKAKAKAQAAKKTKLEEQQSKVFKELKLDGSC